MDEGISSLPFLSQGSPAVASAPDSGVRPTAATAPPPSMYSRAMLRERIDRHILRSLGERRVYRTLRQHDGSSGWDRLEALIAQASTMIWEDTDVTGELGTDLAAYCAFLARELELNEQLDLPASQDAERLRSLAPRALDTLDGITGPLVAREDDPHMRSLARTFGAIRAELLRAAGPTLFPLAA